MMLPRKFLFYFFSAFIFIFHFSHAQAEQLTGNEVEQLAIMQRQQDYLEYRITQLQETLAADQTNRNVRKELRNLEEEKQKIMDQKFNLATGITLARAQAPKEINRDLLKELQEFIMPFFDTFKRLSERPRKIEQLNLDIDRLADQIKNLNSAFKRLELFKDKAMSAAANSPETAAKLSAAFDEMKLTLENQKDRLSLSHLQAKRAFEQYVGPKQSMVHAWSQAVLDFFKTKGRNLLAAALIFTLCFLIFGRLKMKILALNYFQSRQRDWIRRPFNIIFNVIRTLISIALGLLCLYLLNDWFLVTFSVLLLTALFWSLKHLIPRYFEQAKILMNLGPIREGEIVMWRDLPWKITTLGAQSYFENPRLSPYPVRVPLSQVLHEVSRPVFDSLENEMWFPTVVGDWVEGGVGVSVYFVAPLPLCQVIDQNFQWVTLKTKDEKTIVIKTADFLKISPSKLPTKD